VTSLVTTSRFLRRCACNGNVPPLEQKLPEWNWFAQPFRGLMPLRRRCACNGSVPPSEQKLSEWNRLARPFRGLMPHRPRKKKSLRNVEKKSGAGEAGQPWGEAGGQGRGKPSPRDPVRMLHRPSRAGGLVRVRAPRESRRREGRLLRGPIAMSSARTIPSLAGIHTVGVSYTCRTRQLIAGTQIVERVTPLSLELLGQFGLPRHVDCGVTPSPRLLPRID
jgi:hypothetical protein